MTVSGHHFGMERWQSRLRLVLAAGLMSGTLLEANLASADQTDPALGALFATLKMSHQA